MFRFTFLKPETNMLLCSIIEPDKSRCKYYKDSFIVDPWLSLVPAPNVTIATPVSVMNRSPGPIPVAVIGIKRRINNLQPNLEATISASYKDTFLEDPWSNIAMR